MLDRFMGFIEDWPVSEKTFDEQVQKKREKALLILEMLKKEEYCGKSYFSKLAVLCAQHNFVPGLEYIAASSKKHLVGTLEDETGKAVTPFETALLYGSFDAIHYLIRTVNNKPASLFFNDLQEAVVMNDLATVKRLMKAKFDKLPEIILIAVSLNYSEIVKELCPVEKADFETIYIALDIALRNGCAELTTYLVNGCLARSNDEILNRAILAIMQSDSMNSKSLMAYIDCLCTDTKLNPEKRLTLLKNALDCILVSDFEHHMNECAVSLRKLLASSKEMPAILTKTFQIWLARIVYQYKEYRHKTYNLLIKMYALPELDSKIMLQSLKKEVRFMLLVNTIKTSKLNALICYLLNVDLLDQTDNGNNLAHLAIEKKIDNVLLFFILNHKPELLHEKNSSGLAPVDLALDDSVKAFINPDYKALRVVASAFFHTESCRIDLEDSVKWGRIKAGNAVTLNATERALTVLESNSCEQEELNSIYSLLSLEFTHTLLEIAKNNLGYKHRLLELLEKVYLIFQSKNFSCVYFEDFPKLIKLFCHFGKYENANNLLQYVMSQEVNDKVVSMPFVRTCEFSYVLGLSAELLGFSTQPSNLDEFIFLSNDLIKLDISSLVGTMMSPFFLTQPWISSIPKETVAAFQSAVDEYTYNLEKPSKKNDNQESKYECILEHCYVYLTWFDHFTNIPNKEVSLEDRKFYLQVRLSVIESISRLASLIYRASPGLDKIGRMFIDRQKLEVRRQLEELSKQMQEENAKPIVLIVEPTEIKARSKVRSTGKSSEKLKKEPQTLEKNSVTEELNDNAVDLPKSPAPELGNNNAEAQIELMAIPPMAKESLVSILAENKILAVTAVEPPAIVETDTKFRRKAINLYTNILRLFELLGDEEKYQAYEASFNAFQASANTSSPSEDGKTYEALKKLINDYRVGVDYTYTLMRQRIMQLGDYTHFLTQERVNLAMSSGASVTRNNEVYDKATLVKVNRENYEKAFEEIADINEKMGRLISAKQLLANSCLEISDFTTFFSQFNMRSEAEVSARPTL